MTTDFTLEFTSKQRDRFLLKVRKGASGCWNWMYSTVSGYGCVRINKKTYYAHRISYVMFKGSIPDNLQVLHHCDNRLCVNPDHIYLGTPQNNVNDTWNRDRSLHYGENHEKTKFTDAQVEQIKELYSTGNYSQKELSEIFNCNQCHISRLFNNKRRTRLTPTALIEKRQQDLADYSNPSFPV